MSTRYQAICNSFHKYTFRIFGCGAIGSCAAISIAMMNGKKFVLYDMDSVSEENIGVSIYDYIDLGKQKVKALSQKLKWNGAEDVYTYDTYVDKKVKWGYGFGKFDIPILAFDNMHSRLEIAEMLFDAYWADSHVDPIVIDARMGAEQIQLYTVKDFTTYKNHWYPDSEAGMETCTNKGTSYCSLIAGGLITNQIKKFINKEPYAEKVIYHIPSYSMECETMVIPQKRERKSA